MKGMHSARGGQENISVIIIEEERMSEAEKQYEKQ